MGSARTAAVPMAKLKVFSGGVVREIELAASNSIGRHPSNTIQILDPVLSKEHAVIVSQPNGRWLLRDLDSLNGTFVDGQRIRAHELRDGHEFTIGSCRLVFVDKNEYETLQVHIKQKPVTEQETGFKRSIAADERSRRFAPVAEVTDPEMIRSDYERLRIAYELSHALGAELDLNTLLSKVLDQAFQMLRADRGIILLVTESGDLVPRFRKQKDGKQEDIVLSRTLIGEVLSQKKAVLSADASMDERFSAAKSIVMQGIRSTMTVPLIYGEEVLGIMHLDSRLATNAFTEKDLQIFTGIAAQAAIAIQNARLATKIEQEAETRAQFQRLIPPSVVDQVVTGDLKIEKGGKLHEITMLYSDIRGFTAMSERKQPQDVVQMLNEYFEVMVDILFRWGGSLDKFVGDELIGLFGAPIDLPDAPFHAVACAVDMMRGLAELNRTRAAEGMEPVQIGIGINTGEVVTGAIGSSKALQYTAIGDAMNVGARLCSAARAGEVIISETTMAHVYKRVHAQAKEPITVKGKSQPLRVFNVVGVRAQGS